MTAVIVSQTLSKSFSLAPGVIFCYLLKVLASYLAMLSPQVGTISFSLLLGVLVANFFPPTNFFNRGIAFSQKIFLEIAIILLGLGLSYQDLAIINPYTIFMLCSMIGFTLCLSYFLGNFLGLPKSLSFLIGMGNAICGAAAIMASSRIIDSSKKETASAITLINILGIASLFLFPLFLKNYSPHTSGFLIGGSLQAMGHVIASTSLLDAETEQYAITIKMARIFLLTPVIFILSLNQKNKKEKRLPGIPYYILGFIGCVFLASSSFISAEALLFFKTIQRELLAIAMAGLGLSLNFSQVFYKLSRNLVFGASVFLMQIIFLLMAAKFI